MFLEISSATLNDVIRYGSIGSQGYLEVTILNFSATTVPADDLASLGSRARPSAGRVMIKWPV